MSSTTFDSARSPGKPCLELYCFSLSGLSDLVSLSTLRIHFLNDVSLTHQDILKFEYMSQLLLDSNYIPLILKMFAHQDVDQTVAHKNDREDLSYVTQPHLLAHWLTQHPASSTSVKATRISPWKPKKTPAVTLKAKMKPCHPQSRAIAWIQRQTAVCQVSPKKNP